MGWIGLGDRVWGQPDLASSSGSGTRGARAGHGLEYGRVDRGKMGEVLAGIRVTLAGGLCIQE